MLLGNADSKLRVSCHIGVMSCFGQGGLRSLSALFLK